MSFHDEIQKAFQNQAFLDLEDEHKRIFVNKLMDMDESTAKLTPEHRQTFLQEYVKSQQPEPEPEDPRLQARALRALGKGVGAIPLVGPALTGAAKGAVSGIGGMLGGLDVASEMVERAINRPSEMFEGEYEPGVLGRMGSAVSEAATGMSDSMWTVDSWQDVKGVTSFAHWASGGVGQTVGYIAPALVGTIATGGGSILPWMAVQLTGEQRQEVLEETGTLENPVLVAASGATQAAVERLFGPESRLGRNLFRDGVRKTLDSMSARASTRIGLEALGEGVTEGLQEYINQQVGEWSADDRGWWDNLEAEDKQQVYEGFALGAVVGGMTALPGTIKGGFDEKKLEALSGLLSKMETLTPEERGAAGMFDPARLRELSTVEPTEDEAANIRLEETRDMDFLKDDTEALNAFVQGTLDKSRYTEEQQAQLTEAETRISQRVAPVDEAVVPVTEPVAEAVAPIELQTAQDIVAESKRYADVIEELGFTEKAADLRKAGDSFQLVEAVAEPLRELQGAIKEVSGVDVRFYKAEGNLLIGGASPDANTILVRWDSTAPEVVARKAIHEAMHSVGKASPQAQRDLHTALKQAEPEIMTNMENRVKKIFESRDMDLDEQTLMSESLSKFSEEATGAIFRTLRERALAKKDWAKQPKGIRRAVEAVWEWGAKMSRKSDIVANLIGKQDERFDPSNRREFAQMMDKMIGYLGEGREPDVKVGEKPVKVPKKIKPTPSKISLEPEAKVEPKVKEKAEPKPKAPKPTSKAKEPAPEKAKESPLEQDHGQKKLDFSFEQQAKQEIESGATSIRNVPDAMKRATWVEGTRNADMGGGAFENATNYLKTKGVTNLVWDPYSRSAEHNKAIAAQLAEKAADTGTLHNVLNVIQERAARIEVLENLKKAVKEGGTVSIAINEGQADGKGRESKTGWQNNQPAEFYLPEVEEVFGNAAIENEVITAVNGVVADDVETEVEAIEQDPEFSLQITEDHTPPPSDAQGVIWPVGTKRYRMHDTDTQFEGRLYVRERYQDTPDHEAYVEWVDAMVDDEGNALYGNERREAMGIRRVMALRKQVLPDFPDAIWIGGLRVGGIRENQDTRQIYTRIPLIGNRERVSRGMPTVDTTKVTQDELDERHGPDEEGEPPLDPTEVFEESMETLDRLIGERDATGQMADLATAVDLFDSNDLRLLNEDQELDDMLRNFGLGDSDVEHSFDWDGDRPDYEALQKEYGVERLAGFEQLVEIDKGKWRGDGRTFYHISREDRAKEGLKKEFAGTAQAGQELRRIKAGGERAVHLYIPGVKPEVKVAQGEKVLHKISADLKLLDTRSTEAQEIREEVDDTDTFIRVAVDRGYDGLIDTTNGFVQVYRDIKPEEISESRPMFPGERAMTLGSTRIPGGFEGTFTYEELIWLKEQGIDVSGLSEDVHLKLHEKIVRTMQPEKKDTLQTLNNFIFSMMSPNQPLTPNELGYAVVRVRNNEESQQWAARVPWDAPSGQEPHPDVLEADENKEEAEAHILEGFEQGFDLPDVGTGKEAYFANPGAFRKYYREYYDRKIAREFNLQAREVGGMGLLGTAQMSFVSELNQYYQIDPEWFLMQDADVDENGQPSWHTYVERLSTQFSGIATKVGSFAAVWQDPMNAAISAIDRHMGRLFLPELFETNAKRQKWERGMVKDWNKSEPEKIQNFDELFLRAGGDGFFVKGLMTLFGTKTAALYTTRGRKRETIIREIKERNPNLPAHWREWAGTFLSLPENRRIQLMSDKYRAALDYNAKESKRLGLGLFSSQWFLWDRYRRRLEPHEINFPGLYKLPHLSKERVTKVRDAHGEAGYLNMTPEMVESRSGPEIHLKRVKSAPLGDLTYWSFDEGPAHFPPQSSRTPLFNAQQAFPDAVLDPRSGPMWSLPDESWLGYLRRKIQDKFFRVRQLVELIERQRGSIHDSMDPYLHEMLYHGRAAAQIEDFEKDHVEPLMTHIRKNDIDIEDFEFWLHARHAEERNNHYREVWYERKLARLEQEIINIGSDIEYAEDRGSDAHILKRRLKRKQEQLRVLSDKNLPTAGMSNEDARAVMEEYGDKYKEAAKVFDAMMDRKLEILWKGGLISDSQLKAVSKYKYYVPLKGKNYEGDLEDLLDTMGVATGSGFDIRGDELGFAFGRKEGDRHTHPIIPQAVVDIEEAIIRSEKNRVSQALLALVEENPNEDIYEVDKAVHRRVWDKTTGEVKLVEDAFAKFSDNVIAVKVEGETQYITIKDSRLASAMKNLGSEPMNAALKILAAVNRFLAKVNTTLNPEFMIANFLRDVQTAGFNLSEEGLKTLRGAAIGNIPAAANGIRKAEGFTTAEESEVASDEWVQHYREFVEAGGKIGFFGYNDVLSKARAIDRHMRRAGPGAVNTGIRYATAVGNLVERGNTVVENATRLSAYVAARKAGVSKKRAAAMARNLTVNFNKKGESGQIMNALWLFSNASIQGTFRMGHAVLRSPSVQKLVGAQVMASWGMAALNRGMAGEDDEDGMNYWDKLGDWQKERNFVVMIPGNGDHIKIPLPYGYNIFHVLGTELERISYLTSQGQLEGKELVKASVNMFDALMGAFNPLGGASLDSKWTAMRFAIPSAFAPIMDTLMNETYYGAPIHPVRSSWDHSPDSERYFKGVTGLSRDLTRYLNKWTGGSEYESGWVDMNPEVLDYIVGSYVGAGAKTAKRVVWDDAGWLAKAITGGDPEPLDINNIAFLRRVYGEQNDNTVAAVFYEYLDELKQSQKAYDNLKGKQRSDWLEDNRWKVPLFKRMKEAEKGIRATDDTDAKNRIRKKFNRYYNEGWKSQF